MIPGIEGRHAYYPPGASSPAFTLGLKKTDAGVAIWPRVRLRAPLTMGSLAEPEDNADAIIGTIGEYARPSFRRGKTVTYSGYLEARSLSEWHTLKDTIEQGMADQSAPGRIVASWHPLSSMGTAKTFPARAMGLEIADPIEAQSCFRGSLVAAFRNHDGRYFETLEQSVSVDLATTDPATGGVTWPNFTLPASTRGPTLDVVSNAITNPVGAVDVSGWAARGTHTTTLERVPLPSTDLNATPIFDPPTTSGFHAITSAAAVAGDGVSWSAPVTNGAAVTFIVWIFNRATSKNLALTIRDAGGVVKGTSAIVTPTGGPWTKVSLTVTPNATATWTFNLEQQAGGAAEYYWSQARLVRVRGMSIDNDLGPRINFPSTWDGQTLHLDFEQFSILDDAGHDYSSIVNPEVGIWARNPFGPGLYSGYGASITSTGPVTDPDVRLTFRWTPAYR